MFGIAQLSTSPSTSTSTPTGGEDAPKSSVYLKEAAGVSLDGGVLDAKWCHQPIALGGSDAALLACATSTGRLGLYALSGADAGAGAGEDVGGCAQLRPFSSSDDAEGTLLLSLDWSGGRVADAKVGGEMRTGNGVRGGRCKRVNELLITPGTKYLESRVHDTTLASSCSMRSIAFRPN